MRPITYVFGNCLSTRLLFLKHNYYNTTIKMDMRFCFSFCFSLCFLFLFLFCFVLSFTRREEGWLSIIMKRLKYIPKRNQSLWIGLLIFVGSNRKAIVFLTIFYIATLVKNEIVLAKICQFNRGKFKMLMRQIRR